MILHHGIQLPGNPEEKEEGGAVYEVLNSMGRPIERGQEVDSGRVTLSFGRWDTVFQVQWHQPAIQLYNYIIPYIPLSHYFLPHQIAVLS